MVRDLTPQPDAMRAAAARGHITATDLADWLVRELGLPFRDAHHVTGSLGRRGRPPGMRRWPGSPSRAMRAAHPGIHAGCL